MKYDFDKIVNRRNTYSLKWDVKENELPLWVADMDFETAPEIKKALMNRVEHGVFGYTIVPEKWYESIIAWWKDYHHYEMEKDYLMFCTGVVPAISSIVRKITSVAENVVIQTPVYNIFFNSILNNGRNVLESPLLYENGEYSIDWEDLENKLALPQTTLMILCNPHNPIGKIWDKETLEHIGDLCYKYNVKVISDEIHCDLTDPNKEYIPFASVSDICKEISITCMAPTKCFNLAGLQTAIISIPDKNLRLKVWRGINTDEVAEPNAFAIQAAIAAFNEGRPWLNELREYIYQNKMLVIDYLSKEIPELLIVKSEATYLLWIDCSKVCDDSRELTKFIRNETGLYLSDGVQYGKTGRTFVRMNIACPKSRIKEALDCLKIGIKAYKK